MKNAPANNRIVWVILFGFALAITFFGCGKKPETEPNQSAAAVVAPLPATSLDPVTPEDQLELGYKYLLGEVVKVNHAKAAKLFRKSAENGSSDAQFALGCMYQNGNGVKLNYRESAKWYLKSAQAGNAYGQYLFGLSLKDGSGVPKDPIESYKWIHLAAEQRLEEEHLEARDQLSLILTPSMLAEGKRRADQFLMYQGVGN